MHAFYLGRQLAREVEPKDGHDLFDGLSNRSELARGFRARRDLTPRPTGDLEDRRQRLRGVQVVLHSRIDALAKVSGHRVGQPRGALRTGDLKVQTHEPFVGATFLLQDLLGVLDRLRVVALQQPHPHGVASVEVLRSSRRRARSPRIWPSFRSRASPYRDGPKRGRTGGQGGPRRSGRVRSRGAGSVCPCRRRGCRPPQGGACSPSLSTRCASQGALLPKGSPRKARPVWRPSKARSRAGSSCGPCGPSPSRASPRGAGG